MNNRYIVYKHTSPDGKVYVGITCKSLEERSGKLGTNYKYNKHFYAAIEKYGWNNFSHDILYTDLSHQEACEREVELISTYNATDPDFGYNICAGGEGAVGYNHSDAAKEKISEASKNRWSDPEYRARVIPKIIHNPTIETIKRISESNKKTKALHPKTQEQIDKWRKSIGHIEAWNKGVVGVYHHSEESKKKIAIANKGKVLSQQHRDRISEGRKGFKHTEETKARLKEIALNQSDDTRQKISETVKRRWSEGCYENVNRSGNTPWNKGLKATDDPRMHTQLGYKHTEESKRKMSEAHLGKLPYNARPVMCVETGEIFESCSAVYREKGISGVSVAVKNPNITRGKYHWKAVYQD